MSIPGMPSVPLQPLMSRDPTQLGEFRLLGRLGTGGMGTAFLAQGPSGWVVVKEAHAWVGADPNLRARLAREVAAMRRVAGPRTAAVLDADLDAEIPWVAMEFVPGETLTRVVEANGPLTAAGVHQLAIELAEALRQLHTAGVTHRDLKPANIMMSPTGARLLDLGVAEVDEGTQLTRTGSVMGSTGWLAPEQVRGDAVTAATDIHAWALCVLFAANGDAPFGRDTSAAAIYRVLETTPQVPATIGEPLLGLLTRALAKDPAHRPTVDQIIATLTTPPEPAPTPTAKPATPPQPQFTPRPTPKAAPPPILPTAPPPGTSTRSSKRTWIIAAAALAVVVAGVAALSLRGGGSSTNATAESSPDATGAVAPTAAEATVCDGLSLPCEIGDTGPGGGVVFYDAGSQQPWGRYLEAAPVGWSGSPEDPWVEWCAEGQPGDNKILKTGTGIGAGAQNTAVIIEACGSDSAAGVASSYAGGGQADWFLPSKDELNALYEQRRVVAGLADGYSWSSSQYEFTAPNAWYQSFYNGYQYYYYKTKDYRVRPVRAFGGSSSTNATAESSPDATGSAALTAADATVCDGVSTPCEIGDTGPGGGVVFYDAGSKKKWGRYLEAAPAGWSGSPEDPGVQWCAEDQPGYDKFLKTGTGIGAGAQNTATIIKACGADSAAGVASDYAGSGQDDWFLPSLDELNLLYEQRAVVGGLADDGFWSSSQPESRAVAAWFQFFANGIQNANGLKGTDRCVRPVRAF